MYEETSRIKRNSRINTTETTKWVLNWVFVQNSVEGVKLSFWLKIQKLNSKFSLEKLSSARSAYVVSRILVPKLTSGWTEFWNAYVVWWSECETKQLCWSVSRGVFNILRIICTYVLDYDLYNLNHNFIEKVLCLALAVATMATPMATNIKQFIRPKCHGK